MGIGSFKSITKLPDWFYMSSTYALPVPVTLPELPCCLWALLS